MDQISLSRLQRLTLGLLAKGRSRREIAFQLGGVNDGQVRRHMKEIKLRIGLDSDATIEDILRRARHLGLID